MPSLDLIYRFLGVDAGAGAEFDKMSAKATSTSANLKKFAFGSAAAIATVGVVSVAMADKFETARVQLEGAVENVGGNFDALKGRIGATDDAMQALGFTNTDTETGLSQLVVATKNTGTAMHLMSLAADIARGRNMSLVDASNLLVKVETGHVALLGRLGINTKDATGATISQTEAIQRLTDLYGGDATRFSKTFSGQLQILQAQAQDLGKNIGLVLVPALTHLIGGLDDVARGTKSTVDLFEEHKTATIVLAGALTGALLPALTRTAAALTTTAISNVGLAMVTAKDAVIGFAAGEDAAAASTKGLLTSLGPLAIAVAAVAYGWQQQQKDEQGAADAAQKLIGTVHVQTNSLSSLHAAMVTLQADQKAQFDAGLNNNEVVGKLKQGYDKYGTALASVTAQYNAQKSNMQKLGEQFGLTGQQVVTLANQLGVNLSGSLATLTPAFATAVKAATVSHHPLTQVQADFTAVGGAASTTADDITSLDNAWNALVGNFLSSKVAMATMISDEHAFDTALKKSSGSLSERTTVGRAAISALQTFAADTDSASDAIFTQTGNLGKAEAPLKKFIDNLKASGSASPVIAKVLAGAEKQLHELQVRAAKDGSASGSNLIAGLVAGINEHKGEAVAAAKVAGAEAAHGIDTGAGNASPSWKSYRSGRWLAQGLLNGWKDGTAALKTALSQPLQNALDHMQTVFANRVASSEAQIKSAQSQLKSLASSQRSSISSLAGTISGGSDISNIFGTDANGNPTMGNATQFLSGQVGPLKQEASVLRQLAAKHLNAGLLAEIANLPVTEAIQVGEQFLSGASSIAAANKAQDAINRYSRQAADTVVNSPAEKKRLEMAGIRLAIAKETLAVLKERERHEARKVGHEIKVAVTFDTKGKIIVGPNESKAIIAGINKAVKSGQSKLDV